MFCTARQGKAMSYKVGLMVVNCFVKYEISFLDFLAYQTVWLLWCHIILRLLPKIQLTVVFVSVSFSSTPELLILVSLGIPSEPNWPVSMCEPCIVFNLPFFQHDLVQSCVVCNSGYELLNYFTECHKFAVSDFPDCV